MAKIINVRDISNVISKDVDIFTQVMAAECSNTILSRTPVDTSSLVNSEHITTGTMSSGFTAMKVRNIDPNGARDKQMGVVENEIERIGGHKFYLQTNAPYALDVHRSDAAKSGPLRYMKLYGPDIMRAEGIAAKAAK